MTLYQRNFFLFLFITLTTGTHGFSNVPITPVPDWVKKQTLETTSGTQVDQATSGYYFLLTDYQWNVGNQSHYFHGAYQLVSDAGVENGSELTLNYNPAFQKIYLHHLMVHRGGQVIDKIKTAKIHELQQETSLDYHIYDESKSVYILLDDIRMGDIVEYDYSIKGSNPAFGGQFSIWLEPNMSQELPSFYCRIITPENRPLQVMNHRTKMEPVITTAGNQTEYVWTTNNLKAINEENNEPPDYNPYETIDVSEYKTWEEVEKVTSGLFANADHSSPQIDSLVKSIVDSSRSETGKILKAVHFVQNKIRYMGIEIGENSHRPYSADLTMNRRFGDCKDKSVLLVSLLRKLGYTAYPALVNTSLRENLDSVLPSPLRFNHAIVMLEFEGKRIWIDPTMSYQGGHVDEICCPSYGRALLIDGISKELTYIQNYSHAKTSLEENYTVSDFSGDATLHILSRYEGWDADKTRSDFAETSLSDIQKNYINYYESKGFKLKPSGDIIFHDNIIDNIFIVEENYDLENLWETIDSTKSNKIHFIIEPMLVKDELKKLYDPGRTTPLHVSYPTHITEKISIEMPDDWNVESATHEYYSTAFTCSSNTNVIGKTINIYYEVKTLTNNIPVEKLKSVADKLNSFYDKLGMTISYDKLAGEISSADGSSNFNWLLAMILLAFLCIASYFAYRYSHPRPVIVAEGDMNALFPEPVGGWLWLPLLGLFATPVILVIKFFTDDSFNYQAWATLSNPSFENFHPLWAPLLVFENCVHCFIIVFCVMAIVMFLRNDHRVPRMMIFFYVFILVYNILDYTAIQFLPVSDSSTSKSVLSAITRSLITAAIWIPYFTMSERVKKTFVK